MTHVKSTFHLFFPPSPPSSSGSAGSSPPRSRNRSVSTPMENARNLNNNESSNNNNNSNGGPAVSNASGSAPRNNSRASAGVASGGGSLDYAEPLGKKGKDPGTPRNRGKYIEVGEEVTVVNIPEVVEQDEDTLSESNNSLTNSLSHPRELTISESAIKRLDPSHRDWFRINSSVSSLYSTGSEETTALVAAASNLNHGMSQAGQSSLPRGLDYKLHYYTFPEDATSYRKNGAAGGNCWEMNELTKQKSEESGGGEIAPRKEWGVAKSLSNVGQMSKSDPNVF